LRSRDVLAGTVGTLPIINPVVMSLQPHRAPVTAVDACAQVR
jgi:hypothetical protein